MKVANRNISSIITKSVIILLTVSLLFLLQLIIREILSSKAGITYVVKRIYSKMYSSDYYFLLILLVVYGIYWLSLYFVIKNKQNKRDHLVINFLFQSIYTIWYVHETSCSIYYDNWIQGAIAYYTIISIIPTHWLINLGQLWYDKHKKNKIDK